MSKVLGIDYGSVRIGFAISNDEQTIAFPRGVIEASEEVCTPHLRNIINEEGVDAIVVGLPLSFNGEDTKMTGEARAFAKNIEQEYGLPVHLQNEILTSKLADQHVRDKTMRDARAAALILQSYLDRK